MISSNVKALVIDRGCAWLLRFCQSVINPTIDVWLRSDEQSNIVCNDPKGELYLSFYYVARKRGYRVVAFNLMEPSRTNIYNPLGYAVEAARKGDNRHVEEYVKTIGDVFFPPDKSEDPMWPNAANAAFQRSALGLIDYYMEEDREIRDKAQASGWSASQLNRALDISWGHVTLYNVYQMMTQLAAKKSKDASLIHLDKDDPSDEKDFLTLFFDATAKLPNNALRTSVKNQDNSLRAMAQSEKTIASVYGISLTSIKFFADDNISHLTSGRPSQNFDIMGMSFPRRFEVKLDTKYTKDEALRTQGYKWSAYDDADFKKSLGKRFEYQNNITADGWISYVTKGLFPHETSYLKLEVFEQATGLPVHTWYFRFKKNYQVTLDGRSFVVDPVSEERVVQDGYLTQIQRVRQKDGSYKTVFAPISLPRTRVNLRENDKDTKVGDVIKYQVPLFEQIQVHYVEEPTMVFFITPPHLKSFARIILILINQMFNMQVDESYLTLPSQKPYYKTKYMLDEVGNLSSNGSGIPDLQTKASIGLAQGQQFTLILQTLAQLEDVYGKNINNILQGNVGNILYIKSTDDSMLQILEQLSGKMYRIEHDSQTISNDMYKVINRTDGKLSQNRTVKEVPVITKNNMLQVTRGDLMVFGKSGGNPIWDTNQCAMPYAFQLLDSNPLEDFSDPKSYTLRTVPTTANTMDFDMLNNIPNFIHMVSKRVQQAKLVEHKTELFKQTHFIHSRQLDDDDLSKMDVEELSKEIMRAVNEQLAFDNDLKASTNHINENVSDDDLMGSDDPADSVTVSGDSAITEGLINSAEENTEFTKEVANAQKIQDQRDEAKYAEGTVSKHDLLYERTNELREILGAAYVQEIDAFKADSRFTVDDDNNLYMGQTLMIKNAVDDLKTAAEHFGAINDGSNSDDDDSQDLSGLMAGGSEDDSSVLAPGMNVEVQSAWFEFLAGLPDWGSLANGDYDKAVADVYHQQDYHED